MAQSDFQFSPLPFIFKWPLNPQNSHQDPHTSSAVGLHNIGKKLTLRFFLTLWYILQYEKIQEFSSNDLNSTLYYTALLLSCGQLTCTDLTCFCHTELCGTDVNGQTNYLCCVVNIILLAAKIIPDNWRCFCFWHRVFIFGEISLIRCSFFSLVTSDSLHVQGCGLLQHSELELMWLVDRCPCRVCMHSVWN